MNPAIELGAAGLSSDRCTIKSPFGRQPEGEAEAESPAEGSGLYCVMTDRGDDQTG